MHMSLVEFSKNQAAVVSVRKSKWKPLQTTVWPQQRGRDERPVALPEGGHMMKTQEKEAWKLTSF